MGDARFTPQVERTGQNMSISPDAIGQIFGQGGLDEIARHANLTPEQTSEAAAEVVDRVTPGRSRTRSALQERGWSSTANGKVITGPIIAEIAAPFADPARVTMLLALIEMVVLGPRASSTAPISRQAAS